MAARDVDQYVQLITNFMARKISSLEFEQTYLWSFKNQESLIREDAFFILDQLFGDVDAFCPDPGLRGTDEISEDELRARCESALRSLRSILQSDSDNPR